MLSSAYNGCALINFNKVLSYGRLYELTSFRKIKMFSEKVNNEGEYLA